MAFPTLGRVTGSPAVANGVVYVGSGLGDGNLYALNASSGAKIWSYQTGSFIQVAPAVVNGVVFVGASNTLYALNASHGDFIWSYPTGGWRGRLPWRTASCTSGRGTTISTH